ncbi:oligosaccharide repeat unit polymerase [Bradyrhizobium sp. DASA03007]|uniref:oligosaccharide repeat unit polymerase n=1 Tax=unclassified Bradyrhizobium TaxID=2631580 RepID=UPI003F6E77B7
MNLAFTTGLFLVVLASFLLSGRASVFHPGTYYLFFHGLVFVGRPIVKYIYDFQLIYGLYKFRPTEDIQNLALTLANVGLVSFMATVTLFGRSKFRFAGRTASMLSDVRTRSSLIVTTLISSPLMLASGYYSIQRGTDFERSGMIRDFATMTSINRDTTGYLVDANAMMGPISILIAWAFRFRPIALIPFAAFVVFRMYIGWGRWAFVMTAASLALLYFYEHRRKWPTIKVAATAAALLVVFFFIGQSRSFLQDLISGQPSTQRAETASRNPLDNMDFANLEYLEYILTIVPDQTGTYDYFLRNLQVFTEPIPRAMWPEKPIGPPIQLYNIFQYGFPIGITWTLVGEGWQDLGIAGVLIWCLLAGALLGRLYEWYVTSDQNVFRTALFLVLLPLTVQWFRDGVLLTAIKFPFFFVLPILIWYLVFRQMALRMSNATANLKIPRGR